MRIAVAFYGITRSTKYTAQSIARNIIEPAKAVGEVTVYCHFFKQHEINNPRTGESGPLDVDEWKLLNPDVALLEEPDEVAEQRYFDQLWPYGDAWEDNGKSLRNILRQIISLQRITLEIQKNGGADLVVFIRPDMQFHDRFPFEKWTETGPDELIVPNWQWSGGLNDRFAICGARAYETYGLRVTHALEFCQARQRPMHSERLLIWVVSRSCASLKSVPLRATRVRSNGSIASESFVRVKIAKRVEAYFLCTILTGLRRLRYTFSCFKPISVHK